MGIFRSLAPFVDYKYWLNLHPVALGPDLVTGLLSFFAWFVIAAVVLRVVARFLKKKQPRVAQLLRRFAGPLVVTGILGLLLLFFTYEQAPVLGMRLWFLILGVYFLYLIGRVVAFAVIEFPQLRREDAERARLQKYLPGKKK